MHASPEPVAPPSNDPPRGTRRRKVVASILALFVMVGAVLMLVLARPQSATAQELPIMGTLTGECVEELAVFHYELLNPVEGAYAFAYQLAGSDGTANQSGETTLAAGETFTFDFTGESSTAPEWRVDILDPALGYPVVGQSDVVANPCGDTTTTTTTTTDTTTTTTDTTTTTTTSAPTDTTTTSDTTTDPLPVVTTTTDAEIAPVSSDSSSGGLAQTGVAVVVLVGAAGVLLFNGIGLTTMTRPGWAAKSDE